MSQKNKLLLLLLIVGGLFNVAFASSSSYGSSSSFAVINKPMAYIIQSNGTLGRVDLTTGDYLYGETPAEPLIYTLAFKTDSKQILYAIADSVRQTEWIGIPPLENKARKQSWYTNFNGVCLAPLIEYLLLLRIDYPAANDRLDCSRFRYVSYLSLSESTTSISASIF